MANGIISSAAGTAASTPLSGGLSDMPVAANPMTTGETGGLTSTPTSGGQTSTGYSASTLSSPSQWSMDPTQTVEGRLPRLMDQNNPIIQQAMTASNENMNSRGMLNSSMATTAGLNAAYGVAMPIANADAAAAQKSAAYNADQLNQTRNKNAEYTIQANQFTATQNNALQTTQLDLANKVGMQQSDIANRTSMQQSELANRTSMQQSDLNSKLDLQRLNSQTQVNLAQMDQTNRVNLQTMQNDNSKLLSSNTHAASVFQAATSALNNIAMSTTMDAATKTAQSAQVQANLQNQLRVLGVISGLDLASTLGANPYGTPAAPAAPPAAGGVPIPAGGSSFGAGATVGGTTDAFGNHTDAAGYALNAQGLRLGPSGFPISQNDPAYAPPQVSRPNPSNNAGLAFAGDPNGMGSSYLNFQ